MLCLCDVVKRQILTIEKVRLRERCKVILLFCNKREYTVTKTVTMALRYIGNILNKVHTTRTNLKLLSSQVNPKEDLQHEGKHITFFRTVVFLN